MKRSRRFRRAASRTRSRPIDALTVRLRVRDAANLRHHCRGLRTPLCRGFAAGPVSRNRGRLAVGASGSSHDQPRSQWFVCAGRATSRSARKSDSRSLSPGAESQGSSPARIGHPATMSRSSADSPACTIGAQSCCPCGSADRTAEIQNRSAGTGYSKRRNRTATPTARSENICRRNQAAPTRIEREADRPNFAVKQAPL